MTERVPATGVRNMVDDEGQTSVTEQIRAQGRAVVLDRSILTVVSGEGAGRVIEIENERTVLGRSQSADVVVTDFGVSRRHARIMRWMGVVLVVEDLGSSNGTFINGKPTKRGPLEVGDRLQLGPNLVMRYDVVNHDEAAMQHQLYEGSKRDALTGLYNRGHALEQLEKEVAFAARHGTDLSVVMLDADHFKAVNDTHGHVTGDAALRTVARVAAESCRTEDIVGRYGGEELVIILRGTPPDRAAILAERIRAAVATEAVQNEQGATFFVTVSLGVAALSELVAPVHPTALVALADRRLYRAKQLGRDRVCATGDAP